MDAVRSAFDACGDACLLPAFEKHVAANLSGSLDELIWFTDEELRGIVREFFVEASPSVPVLKRGRCAKELATYAAACRLERRGAAAAAEAPAAAGLRQRRGSVPREERMGDDDGDGDNGKRKAGGGGGSGGRKDRQCAKANAEDLFLSTLDFKYQVAFLATKALLTLALFTIMYSYAVGMLLLRTPPFFDARTHVITVLSSHTHTHTHTQSSFIPPPNSRILRRLSVRYRYVKKQTAPAVLLCSGHPPPIPPATRIHTTTHTHRRRVP